MLDLLTEWLDLPLFTCYLVGRGTARVGILKGSNYQIVVNYNLVGGYIFEHVSNGRYIRMLT